MYVWACPCVYNRTTVQAKLTELQLVQRARQQALLARVRWLPGACPSGPELRGSVEPERALTSQSSDDSTAPNYLPLSSDLSGLSELGLAVLVVRRYRQARDRDQVDAVPVAWLGLGLGWG